MGDGGADAAADDADGTAGTDGRPGNGSGGGPALASGPTDALTGLTARDDWWYVLVVAPIVLATVVGTSLLVGPSPLGGETAATALFALSVVGYAAAFALDAEHVRSRAVDWHPSEAWTAALAFGCVVTLGALTYPLTPYWLYRRHVHVGTP